MRSDQNHAENMETVRMGEKYLGQGVCAVDLAGNEAAYPTETFRDIFELAVEKKVPVIIHAGEAAGPESMWSALELGAVRIGHGIHAIEDTELMKVLKEKSIFLEMCYSSNLQTKTVDRAEDYPILKFMDAGLRITLNTDNLTVSNTALQREYRIVQKQFGLSDDQLKQAALNSVDASFASEDEKVQLKAQIENGFANWLYA